MIESADQKISLSQAQPLIVKVIRVMLHEGVRRGSNTQVYITAVKYKICHVSFSTCSPRKIQKRIVPDHS